MSKWRTSTLFMFYYLLSSGSGVKELPLIRHVPCSNRMTGETGICTFNWSCVNVAHGVHIGHCVDRFFIGTCCKIPQKNATNSSDSGIANPSEENSEMDSPFSLFHILATALKKQETELASSVTLNPSTASPNQNSQKHNTSVGSDHLVKTSSFDYSFLSNHNRKPILPETTLAPKPSYLLSNSVPQLPISSHKTHPGYTSEMLDDRTTVSSLFTQNKTILDNDHNQRKPVSVHATHNQRKPIKKPVVIDTSHDQRNPVSLHDTFNQRRPVTTGSQHNLREPVPLEEDHDQRWPVLNEDSHNEYQSTQNIFIVNLPSNENNSISYDDLLYFTDESTPPNNELLTFNDLDSLLDIINLSQENKITNNSLKVETSTTQTNFNVFKSNDSMEKNHLFISSSQQPSSTISPPSSTTSNQEFNPFNISRVCGRPRSSTTGRIVGGRKSHHLRWPWMISLRRSEGKTFKHKCGATLLNNLWAATAAHCVDGKLPKDLSLRLGEHNFLRSDELYPHVERRVYVMVIHPEFNPTTYENDLALLRFEDPVQYQANIVPVCLPSLMDDITGRIAVVTGWGKLAEEGELPNSLHEVYVPIISNTECEKMYFEAGYTEAIRNIFVCAGVPHGGLDACEGDSGGPMVIRGNNGEWILVGLISWGISCAAPKQPGVYTRISEFKNWINGIIAH